MDILTFKNKIIYTFRKYAKQGLCEKAGVHSYDVVYVDVLSHIYEYSKKIQKPIRILEMGVNKGGSVLLWKELFPDATIIGIDIDISHIDDRCNKLNDIKFYVADQNDKRLLNYLELEGPFDLIIDDASHDAFKQMTSFYMLHKLLRPQGYYVIESIYPENVYTNDFEEHFQKVDLRQIKNRGDDVVFLYQNQKSKTIDIVFSPISNASFHVI